MSEFYDEAAMAKEMIQEFGFAVMVEPAPTPTDPVTGAGGASNPPVGTFAVQGEMDERLFPNTEVKSTDKLFYIHTEVREGDVVDLPDGKWTVIASNILKPDNATQLLSTVLCRG